MLSGVVCRLCNNITMQARAGWAGLGWAWLQRRFQNLNIDHDMASDGPVLYLDRMVGS